jgi:hypothetical protein
MCCAAAPLLLTDQVHALDKENSRERARMNNRFVPSSTGSFGASTGSLGASIDFNDPSNLLNGSDWEGMRQPVSLEELSRDVARRREGRGAAAAHTGSSSASSSFTDSIGYSAVESAFDYHEMPLPNSRPKSVHGDI